MAGIHTSTYNNLREIKNFPETCQETAKDLYFEFETIRIIHPLPLLGLVLGALLLPGLCIHERIKSLYILIPAMVFGGACFYFISKLLADKCERYYIERIKSRFSKNDNAPLALQRLKLSIDFIEDIAIRHQLTL
ncbi:MAG: hypothetical protein M3Q64_03040 [bacterium]|nr:hypothetical protein [bacterium]